MAEKLQPADLRKGLKKTRENRRNWEPELAEKRQPRTAEKVAEGSGLVTLRKGCEGRGLKSRSTAMWGCYFARTLRCLDLKGILQDHHDE